MMRNATLLLTLVVLAACGSTPIITPATIDSVPPELHVNIVATTTSAITVEFQSTEDADLYYKVDDSQYGPIQLQKMVGYTPTLVGFDCNTLHIIEARAIDKSKNFSFDVFVYPETDACPVPQIDVTLAFDVVSSIAAVANVNVTGTTEKGVCELIVKYQDNTWHFFDAFECAPNQNNYRTVYSGGADQKNTFYAIFLGFNKEEAQSTEVSFTTKSAYEIILKLTASDPTSFVLGWEASRTYRQVNTWCTTGNSALSFSEQSGALTGTASFAKLEKGSSYICFTRGSYIQPNYNVWVDEASPRINVQLPEESVGALRVTTLPTPVAQTTVVGTVGQPLAMFELNAGVVHSVEGVRVSKLVVRVTASGTGARESDIGNLALYDGNGNRLATAASTAVGAAVNTFYLINPIIVSNTGGVILTLKGDTLNLSGTTNNESLTYAIAFASDVVATGADTGKTIIPTLGDGNGQPITLSNAGWLKLTAVVGVNASPAQDRVAIVGSENVTLFAMKVEAFNEPMKLTTLPFCIWGLVGTSNDVHNVLVYQDSSAVPFAVASNLGFDLSGTVLCFTWNSISNLLPAPVQPGTPTTLYFRGDIGGPNLAQLGDKFLAGTVNNVTGKGATSGEVSTTADHPATPGTTAIVPFSVAISGNAPSAGSSQAQSVNGGSQIGRFKMTNNGTVSVYPEKMKFTDAGQHTGTTTKYRLHYSTTDNMDYTSGLIAGSSVNTDFMAALDVPIFGGSYRYFTVAIDALGGAVSGDWWQLAVAKLGDLTYCVKETDLGYDANLDGKLQSTICGLPTDGTPSVGAIVKQ